MNKLYRRWRYLRSVGVSHAAFLLRKAILGHKVDHQALSMFQGHGLEIGGPSQFFTEGNEFPVYSVAHRIDNVNFSHRTFWEGKLEEGENFRYSVRKAAGHQYICEASELQTIADSSYDFVASCHTLEHCANPIKALIEWRRALKPEGWLALVVPHMRGTFDHRRKGTEFEHLLADYNISVGEDDPTHFAEILEKHDLDRDPAQESREQFEKWILANMANRGAHHHVFDPALLMRLVDHVGFEIAAAQVVMPFHIFILAQKSEKSRPEKEKKWSQIFESCTSTSPFRSDRDLAAILAFAAVMALRHL